MSLFEHFQPFGTEAQCVAALKRTRWPNGFRCPSCGGAAHCVLRGSPRKTFQCNACPWWARMGRQCYPHAQSLLITADGGGNNASRNRLWKAELQKLADELGLAIDVRHFPSGTGKWNNIEHRMFCHITENWRGRPLINHEVIVNLIANTTTTQGLEIRAELDAAGYPTGIAASDEEALQRGQLTGGQRFADQVEAILSRRIANRRRGRPRKQVGSGEVAGK